MKTYPISNRNRVKRISNKSDYSKETVHAIIDEALFCHLGIIHDGKPVVIPTIHARMGDHIVFHGSNASRLLKISNNNEICVTITLLDGLVMARSLFNSSMNYRSAVIFGKGEIIKDHNERMAAFKSITDHIAPGRWDDARQPNNSELKQTSVVRMPIDEASAKISVGPPDDEDEDYALDYWAGVIPINQTYGEPESDPILQEGITIPGYLKNYCRG
ncbi:MAG TPA: pyridoxamine 5'-phosphate oxidase family protein [Candidatus Marinimicrobia bacterium]|jgi:nitroimidazol reductase NimA-like FMN-containing flavoprotein (pyridoxamine 5'-phosphate oxidase superfamily)|nr:MAG: pyridoxamine 5'-phosphate oxidase family protein [Candidatus Neomarinimicrobiota bacterium]HIA23447.1 pyridoxamine 5'-phosphate oxidase family protein [Candidatus Neomarinimicrobiota bacterium]HIB60655.1 pyridoxamine 5'-phosphate oxidase family protein [Candidatus Neomarinimicrobiota bacterium]